MAKEYQLSTSLEELLAIARVEVGPVRFEEVRLGSIELKLLQIEDMPRYLNILVARARSGEVVKLPMWAKIWTPCLILSLFLQRFPISVSTEILEVGAGGGLCSLVAGACGYTVTLTELEQIAMIFCRINVLKNGLEDRVTLQRVDFTRDRLGRRFGYIIACEVLYNEEAYTPFLEFLDTHLALESNAEVLLALDKKRTGNIFFIQAQKQFRVLCKEVPYIDQNCGENKVICLYRLQRK